MKITSFIVGHVRPAFKPWQGFHHLLFSDALDASLRNTDLILPTQPDLQGLNNNVIGEYYYLFGLRRVIELNRDGFGDAVMVTHYRRFLSPNAIGTKSSNAWWAHTIPPNEAENLNPLALLPALSLECGWFVGRSVDFSGGILNQFVGVHPAPDLLRFLACAIDLSILRADELRHLLLQSPLIPAPSVALLPISVFLRIYKALEICTRAFFANGFQRREGYQSRSAAFCLERLHSFLLAAEVAQLKLDVEKISGVQIVVSENAGVIAPTV